ACEHVRRPRVSFTEVAALAGAEEFDLSYVKGVPPHRAAAAASDGAPDPPPAEARQAVRLLRQPPWNPGT
ncbi:MAG TPA: hypothetical protein VGQ73_00565, partial [Gemmatimonadales bacterium]|nr:hypothetical protein [Gemmatimonadales bacterium]